MTESLPLWDPEDPSSLQYILDFLWPAIIDTGGRQVKLRFGSNTLTYPGGNAFTNNTTVTHGLGGTPVAVLVTGTAGATVTSVNTVGATTFIALGHTDDGSTPGAGTTVTFYWLALG